MLTLGFQKQRLKSALWYRIGKIVDEETLRLGVNATPQFIGSLTELTWAQIGKHSILSECWGGATGTTAILTDFYPFG
jgi:centromere protein S